MSATFLYKKIAKLKKLNSDIEDGLRDRETDKYQI